MQQAAIHCGVDKCYRVERQQRTDIEDAQQLQITMFEIRKQLGILSVRAKIESRSLQRMGNILRMTDTRFF